MTQSSDTGFKKGPLPLVFGITGHRDLRPEDIDQLEKVVRDIFEDAAGKHPHTPLCLFSPLAEGADRLAARVALEMKIRLIVPLPLAKEQYERDFQTVSKAEFHGLLEKASQNFELPLLKGYSEQDVRAVGEARNHHYAQVGAYIARHSHILIALWDGQEPNKIGGTADVVKFKLEGVPVPYGPAQNPLDPVESGPVYHVVTPRIRNPQPANAMEVRHLFPSGYENDEKAEQAYRRIFSRIETFNRDAVRWKKRPGNALIFDADAEKLSSQTAKGIRDWYTIADGLAERFQRRDHWALVGLVILSIATAVLLQVSSGEAPWGWYLAYQGCLVALYGLYGLTWWRDFHGKYLEYRALAEGLRVQFFWWLAGIHESVADHYLQKQRGDLDWIRQTIRMRTVQSTSDNVRLQPGAVRPERMSLIRAYWLGNQTRYFAERSSANYRKSQVIRCIGYGACAVPVVLAIIKRFLEGGHPLLIGMGLSLVVAAALMVYARVQGYAEHSKHYERMRLLFERAEKKLRELLQPGKQRESEAQGLLMELGKEALIENSDWVLPHRERPPEPKG